MIYTNVPEMLVSGAPYCPEFAYNAVPAMEMLFVYCSVHTAETKGPNVLPCHVIINFYDAFLAGNSRQPFFFSDFLLCRRIDLLHNLPLFSIHPAPFPPSHVPLSCARWMS